MKTRMLSTLTAHLGLLGILLVGCGESDDRTWRVGPNCAEVPYHATVQFDRLEGGCPDMDPLVIEGPQFDYADETCSQDVDETACVLSVTCSTTDGYTSVALTVDLFLDVQPLAGHATMAISHGGVPDCLSGYSATF